MRIKALFRRDFFAQRRSSNIDINDDSIDRWILWHYKYDPERHERRNVVIACFNNPRAFKKALQVAINELKLAQMEKRAEIKERITGVMWRAGYRTEIFRRRSSQGNVGVILKRDGSESSEA